MILLLAVSFIAGILTIAAPCILPLLPIIIGGSLVPGNSKSKQSSRPIIIAASLGVSVIVFTLLLKASTLLLGVPTGVWQIISGFILLLFGLQMLLPQAWEKLSAKTGLYASTNKLLGKTIRRPGVLGAVLMGAALGPVFSSCSPTYSLIVATILPASFLEGLLYLTAYAIGLSGSLLIIAFVGQSLVQKLGWFSNPHGIFKRIMGLLFIAVGLFVSFGVDKKIQAYVLQQGWYEPVSKIEKSLR